MRRKGPMRDLKKEREWRERERRWKWSGESVRAFCRQEGLHESAFYAWRRELARRREERQAVPAKGSQVEPATPAEPVRFLPVQVAVEERTVDRGGVEILLGAGRTVRVRRGFDQQTLIDVVAVLEASPC
jgi:transposase-like protein